MLDYTTGAVWRYVMFLSSVVFFLCWNTHVSVHCVERFYIHETPEGLCGLEHQILNPQSD